MAAMEDKAPARQATVDLRLGWSQKLALVLISAVVLSAWAQIHVWLLPQIARFGLASWGMAFLSSAFYCGVCLATLESSSVLFLHLRAQKLDSSLPVPRLRVAMIATKVPSEPLSMLQATCSAMLAQDYPHPFDVWLADEDPDAATSAWCAENGIRISCRKGVEAYHRPTWPRRTRCKEGNLAYFYDHWGYRDYDVVAQFDADHVPEQNYLSSMLPAFLDDTVGYAALPSICGANEKDHGWAVRMRLFAEGLMHGSAGCSLSAGLVPCAIGSHYAVRTSALQDVGGIGPELDEDMSTSIMMSAAGYKGVFCIDTIAHGDGPATFEDGMFQEYQWARSGVLLFGQHLRPAFRRASFVVRARMVQIVVSWLGQYALQASGPLILATVALATSWSSGGASVVVGAPSASDVAGAPSASEDAPSTSSLVYLVPAMASPCQPGLLYALQLAAGNIMFLCFVNAQGWMRPVETPLIPWEALLHCFVRPFFAARGMVHGVFSLVTGRPVSIKVTPKGPQGERLLPVSAIMPMAASAVLLAVAGLANAGMTLLAAPAAVAHCFVACLIVCLHYRDHHSIRRLPVHNALALLVPLTLALGSTVALFRTQGAVLSAFSSQFATCAASLEVGQEHPWTLAYTAALLAAALLAFCLSRRAFSTPLRTHRRPLPRSASRGRISPNRSSVLSFTTMKPSGSPR